MLTFWIILTFIALLINTTLFWSFRKRIYLFSISIILSSIITLALYFYLGNASQLNHYFQEQQKSADVKKMLKKFKSSNEIIDAMKKAVAESKNKTTPEQAKGYDLLGRLYRADKNFPEALSAFRQAYKLEPENFNYGFEYLQSLYVIYNQKHTKTISALIIQLKEEQPDNPELLDFLGYDAYMHKNYQEAVEYWEQLLPYLSGNPEAKKEILLAIGKAQKKLVE